MNTKRLDRFALKAPPVPDWYMQVPTCAMFDAWAAGEGRETVKKIRESLRTSQDFPVSDFRPPRDNTYRERAENAQKEMESEYRKYVERTDALIKEIREKLILTWPAYYAKHAIQAIDKVYEEQHSYGFIVSGTGERIPVQDEDESPCPDLDSSCGV